MSGSSIGALIGAMYCAGTLGACRKELVTMDERKLKSLFDPILPVSGLIGTESIMKFISRYIPENLNFEDLKIPLAVVATNYKTGRQVIFSSGQVLQAVRASISIPGIFVPVPYDNTFLIDGGVANPLPIDVIMEMGADITIAVNLHPALSSKKDGNWKSDKSKVNPGKFITIPKTVSDIIEKARGVADIGISAWQKYIGALSGHGKEQMAIKYPNIFETIFQTIDIMGYSNTMLTLKYNPPTVLLEPDLLDFKSLDFHRFDYALNEGNRVCDEAREHLIKKIRNNAMKSKP